MITSWEQSSSKVPSIYALANFNTVTFSAKKIQTTTFG